MDGRDLLLELRVRLAALGDPERARAQEAYMKSALPFHGVPSAGVRAICREVFGRYPFESPAAWRADTRGVWRGATHREERYAALELTGHRKARALQGLPATTRAAPPPDAEARARDALALYEEFVVTGAWWDLVDVVATNRLAPLLVAHRALVTDAMLAWSGSDDLWRRRSAVLCQVGLGSATDTGLLLRLIEPALADRSFWLRKAIGWALRDYARTDAAFVRAAVDALGPRLSTLSRREALKHLAPP